jgi:tetratricopeptide (TPR) repeat protein/DNA-binding winged helix-turn-helix (wHTH) protein
VNLNSQEIRKHGTRIKLQDQPFQILAMLLEHPNELVNKEELRRKLWPTDTFVDFDRCLGTAMNKLRSALCDSADHPRYIQTLPRRGYRFVAPVTHVGKQPSDQPGLPQPNVQTVNVRAVVPTAPGRTIVPKTNPPATANTPDQTGPRSTLSGRYHLVRSVVVLICLSAAASYFFVTYTRSHNASEASGPAGITIRRSVAVLGFKNLSGRQDAEWLSTALKDWMTTELSAGEQLRIVPPETISRMTVELALPEVDGMNREDLSRVRKRVGADFALTGSYALLNSTAAEQIRLDLRLQDTRTGETVSAFATTGSSARLFALVSESGLRLRQTLGLRAVTFQEAAIVARVLPSTAEATRLYSEGTSRLSRFDALSARDFLQKSVAAEPDFPLSHAYLAAAWDQLGYEENARGEARKAFDLASHLPRSERLLVEARYYEMSREWERAIEVYRALVDFFPDDLEYGLALANTQNSGNQWSAALVTITALRALPAPLRDDPRIDLLEADAAYSLGDSVRGQLFAARAAEKALAMQSSILGARALVRQATALQNLGRFDEAAAPIEKAKRIFLAAHELQGAADAATLEAVALQIRGDYVRAIETYRESLALYETAGNKHAATDEYTNIGEVLLAMGEVPAARESYQHALAVSHDLHDQDGEAWATIGLGQVARSRGQLAEANRLLRRAIEISRQTGSRNAAATATSELGIVLYEQGDVASARQSELEGLEVFREIGDKSSSAEYQVALAKISADQGDLVEAEDLARKAADEFEREKNRHGAVAHAVHAHVLLELGRVQDARAAADRGLAMIKDIPDRQLELTVGIGSATVHALSASAADQKQAKKELAEIGWAAHKIGFVKDELEARLVLGKIEMNSGDKVWARDQLEAVAKDAASKGFGLIATKARAALTITRN